MKGKYILACALASLVAIAPLSLIGANAYSYGPYEDGFDEPLLSPLNGFTYSAYDYENNWLVTKACATTYQPDHNNETIEQYGELLYSFYGGVSENFSLYESDIYYYPQLEAFNQLFYLNSDSATVAKPALTALSPFEIEVSGYVVPRRDISWLPSQPTEPVAVDFTCESVPYTDGATSYYNIPLGEILYNVATYGDNLVFNGEVCLFESIRIIVNSKSFTLDIEGYQGMPFSAYGDYTHGLLTDYYGYVQPTPDPPPAEDIDDAYEAVLAVPKAFLYTEFMPNFTFGKLILIILGFIIFGFAIKLCFGG